MHIITPDIAQERWDTVFNTIINIVGIAIIAHYKLRWAINKMHGNKLLTLCIYNINWRVYKYSDISSNIVYKTHGHMCESIHLC